MSACLLHHDYHELGPDCIAFAVEWFMSRTNIPYERRFELYEQEVEERILLDVWELGKRRGYRSL